MARCHVGRITAFEEPLLIELASNFRLKWHVHRAGNLMEPGRLSRSYSLSVTCTSVTNGLTDEMESRGVCHQNALEISQRNCVSVCACVCLLSHSNTS